MKQSELDTLVAEEINSVLNQHFGEVVEPLPVVGDYEPYAKVMQNGRWQAVIFHRTDSGVRYTNGWGNTAGEAIDQAMEIALS